MSKKLAYVTARLAAASFLMLIVLASPDVMAQAEQQTLTPAEETGRWVGLLLSVVFLFAMSIGCYMTPKRTQQD